MSRAVRKRALASPFEASPGKPSRQRDPGEGDWDIPDRSVVALIESRSREIGLAGVHCRSMEFEVTQFSDSACYSRTISAVLAAEPADVLVSRTARGTRLLQLLEKELSAPPVFLERRHFDEADGQSLLEEAAVRGLAPADFGAKFAAAAALAALRRYLESQLQLRMAATHVTFRAAADICVVDSSTARLLELVHSSKRTVVGLFACRTSGGTQLLRQSLLQPSARLSEIRRRQDAVEALRDSKETLERVQQLLPALADLDLLVVRLTAEPRHRGLLWCKAAVRTALRLRHALAALPLLAETLAEAEALRELQKALLGFDLLQELDRVLDSTPPGRGSMAHAALMYAVKPKVNALLDVARQTWTESLEQIHSLHRTLAVKYPDLNIRLEFAEKKGWYLSHLGGAPELLQTMPRGGRFCSSTRELNSENFKLRQAEGEILRRNVEVLAGLFERLRAEAPRLHAAAQAVSALDLLAALAAYAKMSGAVRPELAEDGPVAVEAGRHPTMERALQEVGQHFQPMDFFLASDCNLSESSNFQIITGHNGGGKSTYLQTLAQLVILAQVGSFIPARSATLRVIHSLFTRMGTSDSIEASASSFLMEMQEASHILHGADQGSLVLIDELGRGTAYADGLAICWAFCEKLLELKVRCLFATHFFELCGLQGSFRNMHLEVEDCEGVRRFSVQHISALRALQKGKSRYGLKVALSCLPKEVVHRAETMVSQVDAALKLRHEDVSVQGVQLEATVRQLLALARSDFSSDVLRELQRPWRAHLAQTNSRTMRISGA
ncbi:unnamed protein product [Effrenium voratum]|uniref:DNA mismatch repair proteins mutS family domain-containing protein n=1 Tax=Effrenium voratum TaxID=2562239 RepID=A0AA36HS12_9DINO|nr:unnamed protein product [Effrenium voratum]